MAMTADNPGSSLGWGDDSVVTARLQLSGTQIKRWMLRCKPETPALGRKVEKGECLALAGHPG